MSDLFDQVIQCYEYLKGGDNDQVQLATSILENFYQSPDASEVLKTIIFQSTNHYAAMQATIGISRIFRSYIVSQTPLPQDLVVVLVELLRYPNDREVRRYILQIIYENMDNDETLPIINVALASIEEFAAAGTPESIEAACYISAMLINNISISQFHLDLINSGIKVSNIDTQLSAIFLAFIALVYVEDLDNELKSQYITIGYQLLTHLVSHPDKTDNLKQMVSKFVYVVQSFDDVNECVIPIPDLVQYCLDIVANTNIRIQDRLLVLSIIDEAIDNYKGQLSELFYVILQHDIQFAKEFFYAGGNENFNFTGHNPFSTSLTFFSTDESILEELIKLIESTFEQPEGRFVTFCALYYCFENGHDFFLSRLSQLLPYFLSGLNDQELLIRHATVQSCISLAQSLGNDIVDVSDQLIEALLQLLNVEIQNEDLDMIHEILEALKDIFMASKNAENAFSQCYNIISSCLAIKDDLIQKDVMQSLCQLVKYGPNSARANFQDIYQYMNNILTEGEDNLKPFAINCIAHLGIASIHIFKGHVVQFCNMLIQNFGNADSLIAFECIRSFAKLSQHFGDEIIPIAQEAINQLVPIGSRSVELPDDNEDETTISPSIQATGGAVRTAACIMGLDPSLFWNNYNTITAIIQQQINVQEKDIRTSIVEAAGLLVEALSNCQENEDTQAIIDRLCNFFIQITMSVDEGTQLEQIGKAFECIAEIIAKNGVNAVIALLPKILIPIKTYLSGESPFQLDGFEYYDFLLDPAQRILREVMASLLDSSYGIVSTFFDTMEKLLSMDDLGMRDLAIQFFGDLVFWATNQVSEEMKAEIFNIAYNAALSKPTAIVLECFKQFATKAYNILQPHVNEIMELILSIITSEETKSEKRMMLQDAAVGALGKIAIHLGNGFPFNTYLLPTLNVLPPQMDMDQNEDAFAFYEWLYSHVNPAQYINNFAAVLIRFFSDPEENFPDYCVSDETVQRMKELFINIINSIPGYEDLITQVTGGDEDKIYNVHCSLGLE